MRERLQLKPLAQVDVLGLESAEPIDRLVQVRVIGDLLQQDIERYWKPYIGQPVSVEQLQEFHSWFYDKSRREGFLAYAQTDAQGNKLLVSLVVPRVGSKILPYGNSLLRMACCEIWHRPADWMWIRRACW